MIYLFYIFLAFISIEFLMRLYFKGRFDTLDLPKVYVPHHYLCYQLAPGYNSVDKKTRHDDHGFRGNKYSKDKIKGTFRVFCLGASTTYTIRVRDDGKTYPARMGYHLKQMYPNKDIEVINAGVGGYTSAENFINLCFKVLDWQPDLFVVYHTHNDLNPRFRPYIQADYTGYRKVWYDSSSFLNNMMKASLFFRVIHSKVRILRNMSILDITTVPKDKDFQEQALERIDRNSAKFFENNLLNMAFVAKGHNIPGLFVTGAYAFDFYSKDKESKYCKAYTKGIEEHNEVVRRVAQKTGSYFFDFDKEMPKKREYFFDHVHVTEQGADVKGELFARAIKDLGIIKD